MTEKEKQNLYSVVIDSDAGRREIFKQAVEISAMFTDVQIAIHLNDAKKILKENKNINFIFIASSLNDDRIIEFIKGFRKDEPNRDIKIVYTIVPGPDSRRKTIEKGVILGADAILFRPHNDSSIAEITSSIIHTTKKFGKFSPLALLVQELMIELDNLAHKKGSGLRSSDAFHAFSEKLTILKRLSPDDLDSYYIAAIDLFMNSEVPPKRNKRTYSGASRRVQQIIEQYNTSLDCTE